MADVILCSTGHLAGPSAGSRFAMEVWPGHLQLLTVNSQRWFFKLDFAVSAALPVRCTRSQLDVLYLQTPYMWATHATLGGGLSTLSFLLSHSSHATVSRSAPGRRHVMGGGVGCGRAGCWAGGLDA